MDGMIMTKLLIKATQAIGRCRVGEFWPHTGRVVAEDDFTEEEWAALAGDPILHISPAPDEAEVAAAEATVTLRQLVAEAIGMLDVADFDAAGVPKVAAVVAKLPPDTKGVTKALLAEVWAGMKPAA
jgi:hypothetical protein